MLRIDEADARRITKADVRQAIRHAGRNEVLSTARKLCVMSDFSESWCSVVMGRDILERANDGVAELREARAASAVKTSRLRNFHNRSVKASSAGQAW